jgi:hypothetical protein
LNAAYSEKVAAVTLLEDTKEILLARGLGPKGHIWSIDLVHDLINLEDRSWRVGGAAASRSRRSGSRRCCWGFKIMPKQIKHSGINQRGYLTAPFYAAFERYLIPTPEGSGA